MACIALRSLYVCYLSLEDPLVRTQVVAYLEGLAERGHIIRLLTFEPALSAGRRRALRADLSRRGIAWHSLKYHKRPSLPATIYDTLVGATVASWLVVRHRLHAIHARSHVPAAMALIVRRLTGRRLIFDIRGLMAEEYADAGRWRRGGIAYRITEWIQRRGIERADAIVVLTDRVRRHLFGSHPRPRTHVIPCCADLQRLARRESDVRVRLDLTGRAVMVYVGKLTGVYMDREMVQFFAAARRLRSDLAFLVLTQASAQSILDELRRADISEVDYRIAHAEPQDVGAYLAAADFAVCLCYPKPSLIAASPTKVGEYLAAGLPVVSGPGVGDTDTILRQENVGVVLKDFSEASYERGADHILRLLAETASSDRCRQVAQRVFSLRGVGIPRYDALYREVAAMP